MDAVVNDGGMTDSNAEPTSAPPASAAGAPRLRRRATDRVAAGVASGLADYLNVDPLLVRVVLVGLVLFNGAGLFIYLAAWLFIPVEGRDVSIVEGWIRRLGAPGGTAWTIAWIFLAIVGTAVLFNVLDSVELRGGVGPVEGFVLALVVIVGGILLVRRTAAGDPASIADTPTARTAAAADASAPRTTIERREQVRREPSQLGLYVLGVLLVAVGVLAAIDGATAADMLPGQYAGAALAILGLGLVAGAWWGRARWLIIVGVLLVPIAVALSFVDVPFDQGWGERGAAPVQAAELQGEYRLSGGRLTLDLTNLPPSAEERHIAASVGMGRLLVILPEGARAEVTTEVGAGSSDLFGARQEGTRLTDHGELDGTGGAFVLDLEAGIGEVRVRTASAEE
jgi:phage shock protein PspC (stress-responsive transcriptional regulator)